VIPAYLWSRSMPRLPATVLPRACYERHRSQPNAGCAVSWSTPGQISLPQPVSGMCPLVMSQGEQKPPWLRMHMNGRDTRGRVPAQKQARKIILEPIGLGLSRPLVQEFQFAGVCLCVPARCAVELGVRGECPHIPQSRTASKNTPRIVATLRRHKGPVCRCPCVSPIAQIVVACDPIGV